MIKEDRELLAELTRLNTAMAPLALYIMEGTASAAEQHNYALRLIAGMSGYTGEPMGSVERLWDNRGTRNHLGIANRLDRPGRDPAARATVVTAAVSTIGNGTMAPATAITGREKVQP
jgi:hypothetical protein